VNLDLFSQLREPAPAQTVAIEGDEVVTVSPEGRRRSCKLSELLERALLVAPSLPRAILPAGVVCEWPFPGGRALVHQTAPRVHSFKWIEADSAARHGPGTSYRIARVALPYVIVIAVFEGFATDRPTLSSWNECFFSNQPLQKQGFDTPMRYPALLNCSRFGDEGRPLSWICVQHLRDGRSFHPREVDPGLRRALEALLQHLLETGFNYSSEEHELSSWFSETVSARIDPRLESIEAWERATEADPSFAVEVPWLETKKTLGQVLERMAKVVGARVPSLRTAADVARLVANSRRRRAK